MSNAVEEANANKPQTSESRGPAEECDVGRSAVGRKRAQDAATVKAAFQEKTHANAITLSNCLILHPHYSHKPSELSLSPALPLSLPSLCCCLALQQAGRLWLMTDPTELTQF